MSPSSTTPPSVERRIVDELTVPAPPGVADLYDPVIRRTVVPQSVTLIYIQHIRPAGTTATASVIVTGPRRLKSGGAGNPIDSMGWERAVSRMGTARPEWLTGLISAVLPAGWDPQRFDIDAQGGAA
ncbi:hypothetical protein ACWD33_26370 [Streptomyces xiamenensis]